MPLVAVFHLAYQNPLACLAGSACGVNTANGVSCHQMFPFATRCPGVCTHLDSMEFEALFDTGCLVS